MTGKVTDELSQAIHAIKRLGEPGIRQAIAQLQGKYICVQMLRTGYAAVEMIWCEDVTSGSGYWDINNTGIGRYRTRKEAEDEAKHWAQDEELPYHCGCSAMVNGMRSEQ